MANPAVIVEFVANTTKLVSAVRDIESSSKDAGKAVKGVDWKRIAGFAAGATALAAGAVYIKKSADATTELAKATATLQRATGLDAETASAWVSTLKVRGIAVENFQTALVRLSRTMEKARKLTEQERETAALLEPAMAKLRPVIEAGGDAGKRAEKDYAAMAKILDSISRRAQTARAPLEELGVRFQDVKKGNINAVLLQIADAFANMKNPVQRVAKAQELFGKGGQKLIPILSKGSGEIDKQLDLADKYGATVGQKQVDSVAKVAAAQRELKLAQEGVSISIGSALLPAQVAMYGVLLDVVQALVPVTDNLTVMKVAVTVAAIAWVAYKVAVITSTVASLGLNASLLITIGIFAAVAIALIAIGVGFVIAYKKVGWFRDAVDATWSWIKRYWPLLLGILTGPIGLAVVAIVRNWDAIQNGAEAVWHWIKTNWPLLLAVLTGPFGLAIVLIVRNLDSIENAARTVVNGVKAAFNSLVDFMGGLVEKVANVAGRIANAIKAPINAVIGAFNGLAFHIPRIELPSVKIGKRKIGGQGFGPLTFDFPDIPKLAAGGIVTAPTLAMVGEAGPEAVLPLGAGGAPLEVRVFIGETELRGMVRTEVRTENNRTAQVLLSGAI